MPRLRRDEYVGAYWWVEDERLVAAFAQRLGDFDTPTFTGELYGINADGRKGEYLFGYRGKQRTGSAIKRGQKRFVSASFFEEHADENHCVPIAIRSWSQNGEPPLLELARMSTRSSKRVRARLPYDFASIGDVVRTADRKDAYVVRLPGGRGGYASIDDAAPEAQLIRAVMQSYSDELAIASSSSRNGRYAIVDVTPHRFLLFDRDQHKLTALATAWS